jgi:hypothetical protein
MYGHQIRRAAQVDRTELWTDIKRAAITAELAAWRHLRETATRALDPH